MIGGIQQIDDLIDDRRMRVRSVIFVLIPVNIADLDEPRKILSHRQLDVRIGLAVLQHGVVPGHVFLDQPVLQKQGIIFRFRQDILKIRNMRYHHPDLNRTVPACLKILADPVLQIPGLADIYNLTFCIVMQIDPRAFR